MDEIIQAILQVGVAPVIAGYLLYDYSKKLTAIEIGIVKINTALEDQTKLLEKLCDKRNV